MTGNRQRQHASKIVSIHRKFQQLKFRLFDSRCLGRRQSLLPWVAYHTLKFKGSQLQNRLPCDLIKTIISFII